MFSISYFLLVNNYCFVHAAAFEKNGDAIVIPSAGGTGKTIITIDWVKNRNYRLLGDDLCILGMNGRVLSYPKKMVIYPWHTDSKNVPRKKFIIPKCVKESVKSIARLCPTLLANIRKYNPSLKTISPTVFFGVNNLVDEATLKKIIYLERGEKVVYSNEIVVAKTVLTVEHELYEYFHSAILEFSIRSNKFNAEAFYFGSHKILQEQIKKVRSKNVCIPEKVYGNVIASMLFEEIN